MTPSLRIAVTIDCPDPEAAARFWVDAIGYRRRPGGEGGPYVTVERPDGLDGPPHITFQRVPEPKVGKARLHLDLFVDRAEPMVAAMISSGATIVSVAEAGEWTTRILQDPAGNEFCVIGPD